MSIILKTQSKKEYIIEFKDSSYEMVINMIPRLKRLSEKYKIGIKYKNSIIFDDSKNIPKLKDLPQILTALNNNNRKQRYEYIYDVVCKQLDDEFSQNNYCNFIDDQCNAYRGKRPDSCKNGCCHSMKSGLCEYFKDRGCTIKSISCKLFRCRYLKDKGISFHVNDIYMLKYFFNLRQKIIIKFSYFMDKDIVIRRLMGHRWY